MIGARTELSHDESVAEVSKRASKHSTLNNGDHEAALPTGVQQLRRGVRRMAPDLKLLAGEFTRS
jgi:hypothetical protein